MKKYIYLIACFLFLGSSCGQKEPKPFHLEGLYEFTQGYTGEDAPLNCFLNIEKNGRYTMFVPDYFDYGRWERGADTSQVIFYSDRPEPYYGPSFTLDIKTYEDGKLGASYTFAQQVEKTYNNGDLAFDQVKVGVNRAVVLVRDSVQYPNALNPYSLNLNRWRLKAKVPESCKEISFRTINYLKHMYALFLGQYNSKASTYNYSYSPSPLLFGQNGIATINFNDIPGYWVSTFYDGEQAKQSAEMISALFDNHLKMPKDYKRYDEMWSNLLKQMLDYALEKDFCSGSLNSDTAVTRQKDQR